MSETIPIRVVLSDLWSDLSSAQKFVAVALAVMIVGSLVGSWWNTFSTWSEIRVYRAEANAAIKERNEALAEAAKIATQIRIREEELEKIEVKRDAKIEDVKAAGDVVARDRAEYDRAVRERVPDIPSTEQLCNSLKSLGYPCQPR